jgi:hypothetical protein
VKTKELVEADRGNKGLSNLGRENKGLSFNGRLKSGQRGAVGGVHTKAPEKQKAQLMAAPSRKSFEFLFLVLF